MVAKVAKGPGDTLADGETAEDNVTAAAEAEARLSAAAAAAVGP